MFYLRAFLNSIYNFDWLCKRSGDFGKAGKYFILLLLTISLAYAGFFSWKVPKVVNEVRTIMSEKIPDFRATMKDHMMIIDGPAQPYEYVFDFEGEDPFKLVVDTLPTKGVKDASMYLDKEKESGLVILEDRFFFNMLQGAEKNGVRYQEMDYSEVEDFVFTKTELMEKVAFWSKRLPAYAFVSVLAFTFLAMGIFKMIHLALVSLVVWLVSRFGDKKLNYKEIFVIGLFALTLPSVLSVAFSFIGRPIPFLYSLMLTIILFWTIFSANKDGLETAETQDKAVQ